MDTVKTLRKEIISAVEGIDSISELQAILSSVVRPTLERKVAELFKDRKIKQGDVQSAIDSLVANIMKASGSNAEKLEFVDMMSQGKLYDCKSCVTSTKVTKLKSFMKKNDPIMNSIFKWFVAWAPKIAGQGVGGFEPFLILNDIQGDNSQKGDAYLGSGYNIEVKTSGGGAGESNHFSDALKVFISEMNKAGIKLTESQVFKEAWGFSTSSSASALSQALNRASTALFAAGKSDKDIAELWQKVTNAAMMNKSHSYTGVFKNGMTDVNAFKNVWTASAIDFYKITQGFDIIYVLDTNTLEGISYKSGKDFLRAPIDTDNAFGWKGCGSFGGTASPRLLMRSVQNVRTELPGIDYKEIKKVADNIVHLCRSAANKGKAATAPWRVLKIKDNPVGYGKPDPDKKAWVRVSNEIVKKVAEVEKVHFEFSKADKAVIDKFLKDVKQL